MSTQTIPCKAKDPRTCPYHGAEIKAKEAVDRGDFDAAFKWLQERDEAKKTSWEVLDFLEEQEKQGNPYTPGRNPYTYAADYLRMNPKIVPADIMERFRDEIKDEKFLSRSEASQVRSAWAEQLGIDDQELAFQHSEAYMQENDITPTETREQARGRMQTELAERRMQMKIMKAQAGVEQRIKAWESDDVANRNSVAGEYNVAGERDQTGVERIAYKQAALTMLELSTVTEDGTRVVNRDRITKSLGEQEYGEIEDLGYYTDDSSPLTIDASRADEVNAVTTAWNRTRTAIDTAIIGGIEQAKDDRGRLTGAKIDVVKALKKLDELYYTEG